MERGRCTSRLYWTCKSSQATPASLSSFIAIRTLLMVASLSEDCTCTTSVLRWRSQTGTALSCAAGGKTSLPIRAYNVPRPELISSAIVL